MKEPRKEAKKGKRPSARPQSGERASFRIPLALPLRSAALESISPCLSLLSTVQTERPFLPDIHTSFYEPDAMPEKTRPRRGRYAPCPCFSPFQRSSLVPPFHRSTARSLARSLLLFRCHADTLFSFLLPEHTRPRENGEAWSV